MATFNTDKESLVIGYARNISALKISRVQAGTQTQLADYYEQLSSGLRINKASADPAGLAVSGKLSLETRVISRARLNVNDGISFANSADAAYQATSSILNRLGELANQAASGSLSSSQRNALSAEFTQLQSEVTRIQESTRFNGRATVAGDLVARAGTTISSGAYNDDMTYLSADGRYVTYADSATNTIYQKDLTTNTTVTVATGVSAQKLHQAVTPFGDTVAYFDGSGNVKVWDRATGTTSTSPINIAHLSAQPYNALTISNDGSKVAFLTENQFSSTVNNDRLGFTGGEVNIAIFDVAANTIFGDDGNTGFSADVQTLAFSPDGSRLMVQGTDTSYGAFGAGSYVVDNLSAGQEFFEDTAFEVAIIGADNAIYYTSSNYIWKKSGASSATQLTTNALSSTTSLFSTDGGNSISIVSNSNPNGTNSTGANQLFKVSLAGNIQQVTNYTSTQLASYSAIARDGNSVLGISGASNILYDTRPQLSLDIDTGDGALGGITGTILSLQGAVRGIRDMSIASQHSASVSVSVIRDNVDRLTLAQSGIGIALTRYESAHRSLLTKFDEFSLAHSRIRDVDVADTVAHTTRLQILAESQAALLGQASRIEPGIALSLLESSRVSAPQA